MYQDSNGNCLECNQGFLRSIDRKTCLSNPEEENCASYDTISCFDCKLSYIYNQNSYIQ